MADYGFSGRVTITELLKRRGYTTGHFGKWHMGPDTDGVYGIDEYAGGERTKGTPRGRDAGLFDSAIDFIKRNASKNRPFYVNIWGHITHYPVNPHESLAAKFSHVKVDRNDFSKTMQHKFDACRQLGGDLDRCMQRYLGDVYALDTQVARVLKLIDELGIRDNTIVVFSSDHGPAPIKLGKDKHTKEFSRNMLGYAGPFPRRQTLAIRGRRSRPVHHPLARQGQSQPRPMSRTSPAASIGCPHSARSPVLTNKTCRSSSTAKTCPTSGSARPALAPSRCSGGPAHPTPPPPSATASGSCTLGKRRGQTVELYDLSKDPSESRNIADKHADVVARLTKKIKRWVAELPKAYDKVDNEQRKKAKKERRKLNGAPWVRRTARPTHSLRNLRLRRHRDDHRHTPLILAVVVAVDGDECAFFDVDRDQDIGRRHHGEEQVAARHGRRRPERDNEAEHQRVADPLIQHVFLEPDGRVLAALEIQPDLPQAEQVEVIDEHGRVKDQRPADGADDPDDDPPDVVLHMPNGVRYRPPLPVSRAAAAGW